MVATACGEEDKQCKKCVQSNRLCVDRYQQETLFDRCTKLCWNQNSNGSQISDNQDTSRLDQPIQENQHEEGR